MSRFLLSALITFHIAGSVSASGWKTAGETSRHEIDADLVYAKRSATRTADGHVATAHLAFFSSKAFRLEVVDLGDGPAPAHGPFPEPFRIHGCLAGVNGGFFHPDWRPSGLVIAGDKRIHTFESAKLLSGVIYSDDRGIHLVRRAQFQDHPGIRALLQTGPFLVEAGQTVRGLSASDPRRRSFIATDWRGNWAIGATQTPLTLAELGELLASDGAWTGWKADRAINLDGGSSTGFYFDRGAGNAPVSVPPWKRVRNLLGIVPR